MFVYSARLLATLARHHRSGTQDPKAPTTLSMRAWPWYCDNNRHINNGVYMTLMDFGRTAWIARQGLIPHLYREKIYFVVGAAAMTYRRPVDLMERFTLETRLHGHDERWFYIEQIFRLADGRVAVRGLVRGMARSGKNSIPVTSVIEEAQRSQLPEVGKLSDEVRLWLKAAEHTISWIKSDDQIWQSELELEA